MRSVHAWMAWLRQSRFRLVAERWDLLRQWLGDDDGSWNDSAPRPFLLFLALFGVAMIAISLFGDQGLLAYRSLSSQAWSLRQEVADLEGREADLARQIRALRSDPAAIETLARQKLGLAKPGETVIQLPRPPSP
jgi:cell division protein FtsB